MRIRSPIESPAIWHWHISNNIKSQTERAEPARSVLLYNPAYFAFTHFFITVSVPTISTMLIGSTINAFGTKPAMM